LLGLQLNKSLIILIIIKDLVDVLIKFYIII
jgi:hypothetical protein